MLKPVSAEPDAWRALLDAVDPAKFDNYLVLQATSAITAALNGPDHTTDVTGYVLITYVIGDKTGQYNRSCYFYADRDLAQAEGEKIAAKGDASFLGDVGFEVLALGASR